MAGIAAMAALLYLGVKGDLPPRHNAHSRNGDPVTPRAAPSSISERGRPNPGHPNLVRSAVAEIQSSPDIRASYDKYRSHPDPSGEIAFRLSLALDDCIHFADKPADQISQEMNAVGKAALQSAPRRGAIERRIERCKGFKGWPLGALSDAARDEMRRATEMAHPGAVASTLVLRVLFKETAEQVDTDAMRLLSGNVDGAVLRGIFNYLSQRNGEAWLSQFGDPAVMTAAWALLQCNHGAACDDTNPFVWVACIYYAACDQHDLASALPFIYPSLTPQRLHEAVRIQSVLAFQIQNRDWARLGFSMQPAPK